MVKEPYQGKIKLVSNPKISFNSHETTITTITRKKHEKKMMN
jgi:hypothetical protein